MNKTNVKSVTLIISLASLLLGFAGYIIDLLVNDIFVFEWKIDMLLVFLIALALLPQLFLTVLSIANLKEWKYSGIYRFLVLTSMFCMIIAGISVDERIFYKTIIPLNVDRMDALFDNPMSIHLVIAVVIACTLYLDIVGDKNSAFAFIGFIGLFYTCRIFSFIFTCIFDRFVFYDVLYYLSALLLFAGLIMTFFQGEDRVTVFDVFDDYDEDDEYYYSDDLYSYDEDDDLEDDDFFKRVNHRSESYKRSVLRDRLSTYAFTVGDKEALESLMILRLLAYRSFDMLPESEDTSERYIHHFKVIRRIAEEMMSKGVELPEDFLDHTLIITVVGDTEDAVRLNALLLADALYLDRHTYDDTLDALKNHMKEQNAEICDTAYGIYCMTVTNSNEGNSDADE